MSVSLPGRPRARRDEFALCQQDGFWFRPAYTGGTCPVCGEPAPGGTPVPPFAARVGRTWLGVAMLALESLVMAAFVLFLYFHH